MEKIRIGITPGDINGVGYEVILKTFTTPEILELCTPIIYGNPKTMAYHRKACGLSTNYSTISKAEEGKDGRVNLVVVSDVENKIELGVSSPEAGQEALACLEAAVSDWKEGNIDVIVTAPINKHNIQSETFHFPGHTEFIQDRLGEGQEALMILMNNDLRVALVTTHVPISEVAGHITAENILKKLRILDQSLRRDFLITHPRIAVLALNPHAGDDGLIGEEEKDFIKPAMQLAEEEKIHVFGPFPADGFFGNHTYDHYDAVLAMYHDQGLAPFKLVAMDDGVNFTAGLPVVRTSPDHGTAYDIAGKGVADENSFRQALYAAIDIWRNRKQYDEARENPLPKLYVDRREDERRERHASRGERAPRPEQPAQPESQSETAQ